MGVVYLHPVLPPPEETASSSFTFMPDDPDLTICESVAASHSCSGSGMP